MGPQAVVPVHIIATDKINRDVVDRVVNLDRGVGSAGVVSFELPWGTYRIRLQSLKPACSATAYLVLLKDVNRNVTVQLSEKPPAAAMPTIVFGAAPFSFSYVNPALVIFPPPLACNAPITTPVAADIQTENDDDGYYSYLYANAALAQVPQPVTALRLTDSSGGYHYVRIPARDLGLSSRWPITEQFDVTDDVIDYVSGKPEDTLLCPKLLRTTVS